MTKIDEEAERLVDAALNSDADAIAQVARELEEACDEGAEEDGPKVIQSRLTVGVRKDETPTQAIGREVLRPATLGGHSLLELTHYRDRLMWTDALDINELVNELSKQVTAVNNKDPDRAGEMLTAQAHTLDARFNALLRKAIFKTGLPQFEAFMKFALRAQSQCRATWEAISTIQNPPIAGYVGQANIAQGPQQVNNGTSTRAEERKNQPDGLLEHKGDDQWLDRGAPAATARGNSALEAVGEVNGTANAGGQSQNAAEQLPRRRAKNAENAR